MGSCVVKVWKISLKSDINIVTESVISKMFENQLAIEYGGKTSVY